MCGIYFSCSRHNILNPTNALQSRLENRGPDCFRIVERTIREPASLDEVSIPDDQPPIQLRFLSTVLSLRGDVVIEQPLVDSASQSILCWNGEAWKIDGNVVVGNDAAAVLDLLTKCTNRDDSDTSKREVRNGSNQSRVIDAISRIAGPYAFVYYDASSREIFYGRDILGRRSLVVSKHQKGSFAISSICDPETPEEWVEVEPNIVHILDLFAEQDTFSPINEKEHLGEIYKLSDHAESNHHVRKTLCYPGGTVADVTQLWPFNRAEPSTQPLQLAQSSSVVNDLESELSAALQLRVSDTPSAPCGQTSWPRIAVLFSGGLDCALLARLVHTMVPFDQEIDLLNVAFENPRIVQATVGCGDRIVSSQTPYARCPDRVTGISSHSELMKVCPERTWRFVCIDVPYFEMTEHRPRIISLIRPHNTEMDLSIASALYFAARGTGDTFNHANRTTERYTTPARVLLSGLGADELFAGYQRHATAFHRKCYTALINELELDINRLGKRNLGRDDRVISNWGKEVRYPYLDEGMVSWALSLPVWEKCGFGAQPNLEDELAEELEPGKRLLRLLAWRKGLRGVAVEKKRAIQFGARTAKMEIGKVKGTQVIH